ncbi:MAG TPA: hypothetical protein DIT16_07950 [Clostridium sp.]|nr:hypothetical protein [Clostridium sp.]
MKKKMENIAIEHGDRLKVIPIEHLKELKHIINDFKGQVELNNFQRWIVNEMYQYDVTEEDFKVNSIILIAVHHPFYAKVNFIKDGEKKTFLSLVTANFNKVEKYLKDFLREDDFSLKIANNLPLKRLGVHSGLAKYGRNNITYVDDLGSNFSYVAYFSNMKCEEDTWGEVRNADVCTKCNLCLVNCPTNAILEDRFLINNQRCLSCINESSGEFPDWIPITAHHTLYDCLACQHICPMNSEQKEKIIEDIFFTEEETNMLLEEKSIDSFPAGFKSKVYMLGIDQWYEAIPRNLKVLFDNM